MDSLSRFEVELHSTHSDAVEATRRTLRALPGNGDLVEENGRYFVTAGPIALKFLRFAVVHQGYVKRIVPEAQ